MVKKKSVRIAFIEASWYTVPTTEHKQSILWQGIYKTKAIEKEFSLQSKRFEHIVNFTKDDMFINFDQLFQKEFECNLIDIREKSLVKAEPLITIRQIYQYLLRKIFEDDMTFDNIALMTWGFNHATVMHSTNHIHNFVNNENQDLCEIINRKQTSQGVREKI